MPSSANPVLTIARQYLAAGLGVLPIRLDGSKAPDLPKGHNFLKVLAGDADLVRMFGQGQHGIAIPCGKVSDNLETLDFETQAIFAEWRDLLETQLPGLAARLCLCRTPGHLDPTGGVHARYRCHEIEIPGSTKLAGTAKVDQWGELVQDKRGGLVYESLIETRGEGGYAVAPGSPPSTHTSGRTWEHIGGPGLTELPVVTPLEREIMIASARALNRWVEDRDQQHALPAPGDRLLPGDDFNRRGPDWSEILEPHGWAEVRRAGHVRFLRRPGKDRGVSATVGFCQVGDISLLHVFSSNAHPFDMRGSYSKFRAWTLLNHRGDFKAAARELGKEGYGDNKQIKAPSLNGHASTPAKPKEEPKEEPWEPPVPFDETARPEFPVSCLPPWLSEFVLSLADATQTPPDLTAMLTLAFAGAAAQGRFRALARPGWSEPLNLYVVVVLPPGNRKSAVFSALIKPAQIREREEYERLRPLIAEQESQRRILEMRLKAAETAAARENDSVERGLSETFCRQLSRELAGAKVQPVPKCYADDATPEALVGLLTEQGGTMLLASAEGTIFDIAKGRYSEKPNFDVFLKAHAGDPVRVHRVGREPEAIDAPALTLAVTVQPAVIQGLADCAPMKGQGFLARFLYSVPTSLVGKRLIARPAVPDVLLQRYEQAILSLYRVPLVPDGDGGAGPHWLHLSPEAAEMLMAYESLLEPQLAEEAELGAIQDWGCKLAGASIRLAAILHLLRAVGSGEMITGTIEASTMIDATRIAHEYLLPHSLCAHGLLGLDPRVNLGTKILKWLIERAEPTVSKRDIHYRFKSSVSKVEEIEPPLELLERHGYLRPVDAGKKAPGRPSQQYTVNPLIFKSLS